MKRKYIIFPLLICGILGYLVYWLFFDMNRLPKGDLISEKSSPNGTYTLKAYVTNAGATTDYAVRGELNFNKGNNKPKNIYWNNHEEKATIKWMDENTVVINGHELHVPNESFDFRR